MKTKMDPKTVKEIINIVECLKLDGEGVTSTYRKIYNQALDDVKLLVRESTND